MDMNGLAQRVKDTNDKRVVELLSGFAVGVVAGVLLTRLGNAVYD